MAGDVFSHSIICKGYPDMECVGMNVVVNG